MVQTVDARTTSAAWQWRVWAVVLSFLAVAVIRSLQVGIPLRDPHGEILLSRIAITLVLFVVLSLLDAVLRTAPGHRSAGAVLQTLRRRCNRPRLLQAALLLLAYHLVYFGYHNLKSWDVLNRPRDQMLRAWDRRLLLGHDPAVVLHHLLGTHVAAYVLMVFYEAFSTMVTISFVAAVVLVDEVREGAVFIASLIVVWILGVASYYAIPSLGPFHAEPGAFAVLPHTMIQDTQSLYMGQRAHLLAHPHAPDAFAQVSAFASLHVAVTAAITLLAAHYRLRRTTVVLACYLAVVMVATVYLGWHFAVDDVAGLLIAVAGVWLGKRLVGTRAL